MFRTITILLVCLPAIASAGNVVEPGDTTMSCTELLQTIDGLDAQVAELQSDLSRYQSNAARSSAMGDFTVSSAYRGSFGSVFGPAQSSLKKMIDVEQQKLLSSVSGRLQMAGQRRDYLTGIYNQRCF